MKTFNIEPNWDQVFNFLRDLYQRDKATAIKILKESFPELTLEEIKAFGQNKLDLRVKKGK